MIYKINKFRCLLALCLMILTSCSQDCTENKGSNTLQKTTEVSLVSAQKELEGILYDLDSQSSRAGTSKKRVISEAFTLNKNVAQTRNGEKITSIPIHVFNFDNKRGFAIMSGDNRLPSLIALADSGEISENKAIDNPGFALFLKRAEYILKDTLQGGSIGPGTPGTESYYDVWHNIVYKQDGYCPVKWGQGTPYNKYCPLMEDGDRARTGCAATAMAQLMATYKYPTSYNGHNFNWEEMNKPSLSITGADQVAQLMADLGLPSNLDMSYGGESGANPDNIPRTLRNFGYSNGGSKKKYDTNTIVDELQKGCCVLVGGFSHKEETKFLGITVSTKYSGGHRWLCHGLLQRKRNVYTYKDDKLVNTTTQTEWYVLCNWGWEGYHDGYFLSGVFDASKDAIFPENTNSTRSESSDVKYNYQYSINAIIGIRK